MPEFTGDVTGLARRGCSKRFVAVGIKTRFYQASSSEMLSSPPPQDEETPSVLAAPMAQQKVYAYWMVKNYRDGHGLSRSMVSFSIMNRKTWRDLCYKKDYKGHSEDEIWTSDKLFLGNLEAKRDWGFAADYVEAMWLMLQQEKPEDLVIATGEITFCQRICRYCDCSRW